MVMAELVVAPHVQLIVDHVPLLQVTELTQVSFGELQIDQWHGLTYLRKGSDFFHS